MPLTSLLTSPPTHDGPGARSRSGPLIPVHPGHILFGFRFLRLLFRLVTWVLVAAIVYLGVTAFQVWKTGQRYQPRPAGAIVVMGAAQYDGVPSPDLRARLDQAALLWHQHYASTIMVTGSKEPGDAFTESQASARYLVAMGIPARDILQAGGRDSWQNLSEAATTLIAHGDTTVLMVTDKFHEARSLGIASAVGLTPYPTPTQTSPITGLATIPFYAKEAAGVAVGRIVGFDRLHSLE